VRETGRLGAQRDPQILTGILFMCAGVSMFPFMDAGIKWLSPNYPVMEIVWARFTGHLLFMLLIFLPRYGRRLFATRQPLIQIGRSLLMLSSNFCYVIGIARVPLATASAIGFTSPLIVTALSLPLLGESVGMRRWSAVLAGFLGALLIIRPGTGFEDPAVFLILLSSLFWALYQIATRWVAAYDNAATAIIFTALLGSLFASVVLPFVFKPPQRLFDLFLLAAIGCLGGAGHYLIIRAFACGPAAVIAPLGYVDLLGSTALGYCFFANLPDLPTVFGAAIIVASGLFLALSERRRAPGSEDP
jgi:drug/metabolite transporter (DMT)-like permease